MRRRDVRWTTIWKTAWKENGFPPPPYGPAWVGVRPLLPDDPILIGQAFLPVPEGSCQPGESGLTTSCGRPCSGAAMDSHTGTHPWPCFPVSGSGPFLNRGRRLCHSPAGLPVQGFHPATGGQRTAPLLDDGLEGGEGIRPAPPCLKPVPRHHRPRRSRGRRGADPRIGSARPAVRPHRGAGLRPVRGRDGALIPGNEPSKVVLREPPFGFPFFGFLPS